jgi:hypothetical protein
LFISFWSIRACAKLDVALEYTSRGDNDHFIIVQRKLSECSCLQTIIKCFIVIFPVRLIVTIGIDVCCIIWSGILDTTTAVGTNIQSKAKIVQVITLEATICKSLNPIKWLQLVNGNAASTTIKMIWQAVLATISTQNGDTFCAHSIWRLHLQMN